MARYEVVREILNSCANNQMRDVFFDEIETDDPLEAVRQMLKHDSGVTLRLDQHDEESMTIFAESEGITQKFLFTRI